METDSFSIVSGTTEGSSPLLFTALSQNFTKNDHTQNVRILQRDSISPVIPELPNDVSSKVKKTFSGATVTCNDLCEETIIDKYVTKLTVKKTQILNSYANDLDENQIQVHVNQVANFKSHAFSICETIPEGLSDKPGLLCTQFEGSQDLFASQNISDDRSNNTPTQLPAASTCFQQNFITKISSVPSPAERLVTHSSSPSSCQLAANIDFIKKNNSLQGKIDVLNNVYEDDRYSIMTCSTVPPAPSRQLSPKYVGSGIPLGFSKQENVSKTNSPSSATVNTRASENLLQESQMLVELNTSRHEESSQIKKSMNGHDKSAFMMNETEPWLQGQSGMQESILINTLEPIGTLPSKSQSQCSEIFNLTDDIYILNNGQKCQKTLEAIINTDECTIINTDECRNIGNDLRVTTSNTSDQEIQISSTVNLGENLNSSSGEKKASTPSSENAVSSQILDASSSHHLSHKASDGNNSQKNQSKTVAHDREMESLVRLVTLYDKLLEKMKRRNVVSGIIPQLDKFKRIIDKFIKSQEEERRRLFPREGKEKRSRSQLMEHALRIKQLGERQALLQVALCKNKLLTETLRPCQADHHRKSALSENTSQQPENVSLPCDNRSLTNENISLPPKRGSDLQSNKMALSSRESRLTVTEVVASRSLTALPEYHASIKIQSPNLLLGDKALCNQTDEIVPLDAEGDVSGLQSCSNDTDNHKDVTKGCRSLLKRKSTFYQGCITETNVVGGKKMRFDEVVPLEEKVNAIQGRRNVDGAEQRKAVITDKPIGPQHMAAANIGSGVIEPCQDDPSYFSSTSVKQVEKDLLSKENRLKAVGTLSPQVNYNNGIYNSHVAFVELDVVDSSCPTSHLVLGEISSVTKPHCYERAKDVTAETFHLTTGHSDALTCLPGKINMLNEAVIPAEHEKINGLTETIQKARCQLTQDVASEGKDNLASGYRSNVFTTKKSGKAQQPSMHHRPSSLCSTVSSCLFPVSSKEIVRRIESKYAAWQQGMAAPSIQQTRPTGSNFAQGSEGNCEQVPKCFFGNKSQPASKQELGTSDQTRAHVIANQYTMSVPTNNMAIQQTEHSFSTFHHDLNITTEKSTSTQTACSSDATQTFHTGEPNLQKRKRSLTNPCRKRGRPRKPQASPTIQCDMGNNSKQREIRKYFPINFSPSGEEGNQIDGLNLEMLKRQHIKSGPDIIFQTSTMDGNGAAVHQKEKLPKQGFSCVREEKAINPVLLLKGIHTIQLIEDNEVTGTTSDIPEDFWLKSFAEVRMSESFWNTVDSW